jgi:hypothetical protein
MEPLARATFDDNPLVDLLPGKKEPADYRAAARRLFELCEKYDVDRYAEHLGLEEARSAIREELGLGEDEEL